MPKCKNYMVDIPRFYRFQAIDHMIFGYVNGIRKAIPSMTVTEAIRVALDAYGITEDEYCLQNAKQSYYRILNAIIDMADSNQPSDATIIL